MYRAVLDTNVFISGATISTGAPSQIINHWRNQRFVMIVSPQLFTEYHEVLLRPKIMEFTRLSIQEVSVLIQEVKNRAYMTSGILTLNLLKNDPDDNMILACAEEGKATHLVTGNIKHFPFTDYKGIRVVSPREYLSFLEK